ncbi:DUF4349 domain-containing protein [Paenibacillus oenotherae]|uniref:DUF4349 domain-containing protein n=2 Tax=Paenibacillus oenotherae TaxID=1435645 RepID=A0ABS7D140_9BACL|nr:DUF4349 domain-containing protein [Paenibacillus oenotherae]
MIVVIAVTAMLIVLAGCGGNENNASSMENSKASGQSSDAMMQSESVSTSSANVGASQEAEAASTEQVASDKALAVGGGGQQSGGDPAAGAPSSYDRKLIYKANVSMEVEDYAKAQTALKNLIHLSGGYTLGFTDEKTAYERGGTHTIKIPSAGFMPFLEQLEKVAHLDYQSSMNGTDVTEEYVDLESRLKARQVVEARLIAFMEKATKADDLVRFSTELGNVQLEIEQIKGRKRYLDQNVAYSTVELRIYQQLKPDAATKTKEEEQEGFLQRVGNALKGSGNFVYEFIQGLVVVIAAALPVLIMLAIIAVPGYLIYRRNRNRFRSSGAAASKGGYGMKIDTGTGGNTGADEGKGNHSAPEDAPQEK